LISVNAELLPFHEGEKLYQAFLEGSHQTDDNEFYTQQIERCEDLYEFYFRALRWEFIYISKHYYSALGMTALGKMCMGREISKLLALYLLTQLEKLIDLYFKVFRQTGYHVLADDSSAKREDKKLVIRIIFAIRDYSFLLNQN